jgi:hypothetical protein
MGWRWRRVSLTSWTGSPLEWSRMRKDPPPGRGLLMLENIDVPFPPPPVVDDNISFCTVSTPLPLSGRRGDGDGFMMAK